MSATSTNGDARQAALVECQAALAAGVSITGSELAKTYGKSASWGRSVAAQARAAVAPTRPPTAPEILNTNTSNEARPETEDVSPWVGWVTVLAVLAVAAAAAVASVDHLATLARLAGTTGWKAWLLPVAVDGLAVAAAMALYRAHRSGAHAGLLPWVALLGGLAASVAGNITAVYPELVDVGTLKVAVGATPPLSLALAVELALRQVRAGSSRETGR